MKLLEDLMNKKTEMQITPLIDVVFLLLIYFMVTASLIKKEADLSFMLPAKVDTPEPISLPIEVLIDISAGGEVSINGIIYGSGGQTTELVNQLRSFRAAAEASKSELVVNILPDNDAIHAYIVRVMDACAEADVKNVSFSMTM